MREFISTFKLPWPRGILLLIFLGAVFGSGLSFAEPPTAPPRGDLSKNPSSNPSGGESGESAGKEEGKTSDIKTNKAEDDDYSGTPFTEYGEFNESIEEEADTKFFQYGRFFGVSLGLGFEAIDGYRGALWQGGFPMVDFKVHYWFDFNLAIDLGFFTVQQYFDTTAQGLGHVDINILRVGIDVKYYFNTKNLSAPISFANPYILMGAGSFSKTQNSTAQQTQDADTSLGISLGAGLEFTVSPRKIFFELEGKMHIVTYKDTFTTNFQSVNIPNLTGNFYTLSANILFTW